MVKRVGDFVMSARRPHMKHIVEIVRPRIVRY